MAEEKINGYRRIYVSDEDYVRLMNAAFKGGYIPKTGAHTRRNVMKQGIEALIHGAILAIEYHADELASHED